VRRGSVYWINLEPASTPELGKIRPGIVVSNTAQNERLDSVVAVPLSTRAPEIWPLRLRLEIPGLRESFAVLPGIRQVSKARLHELIAQASGDAVERLTGALHLYLDE
jgi:mRNA interferase MazF